MSDAGRLPLYNRLSRIAGGMPALAERLGLQYVGRTVKRQAALPALLSRKELDAELLTLASKAGAMPSKSALSRAGRLDIIYSLAHHGGADSAAQRLGLKAETRGRPSRVP